MKNTSAIQLAWRSVGMLKKHHPEPVWAQLAVGAGLALPIGVCMMFINGLLHGRWFDVFSCLCVAYSMLALKRLIETLLSEASIEALSQAGDRHAAMIINVIVVAGTALGTALSLSADSTLNNWNAWGSFLTHGAAQTVFLAFVIVIALANWFWWRQRARQDALLHQTMEAQMRLLQAQIAPHFLFNTLANVQSLIDRDTVRAKLMLETFTDYLRASPGQLRNTESTLAAELAMTRSYLELFQIRMQERLRFEIDASDEALAATLPTLMLQPLVENAIEHGLEPKIEGGRVRVFARLVDGRLDIRVEDDGLGLDSRRRLGRQGAGMALSNIRERLHTRYGPKATLTLSPQEVGMRASLSIPYRAHA